mmetsp:Transcript_15057/g.35564  ORF Transcript_15057/g.35564 Transcript_15057/m.35564 type:complete len:295 (-) Transcript_15057:526-1410(-)
MGSSEQAHVLRTLHRLLVMRGAGGVPLHAASQPLQLLQTSAFANEAAKQWIRGCVEDVGSLRRYAALPRKQGPRVVPGAGEADPDGDGPSVAPRGKDCGHLPGARRSRPAVGLGARTARREWRDRRFIFAAKQCAGGVDPRRLAGRCRLPAHGRHRARGKEEARSGGQPREGVDLRRQLPGVQATCRRSGAPLGGDLLLRKLHRHRSPATSCAERRWQRRHGRRGHADLHVRIHRRAQGHRLRPPASLARRMVLGRGARDVGELCPALQVSVLLGSHGVGGLPSLDQGWQARGR